MTTTVCRSPPSCWLLGTRNGDRPSGDPARSRRECLRIAKGPWPRPITPDSLGSALTHANITTDYSESLLEFITPATDSIESLIEQLGDIHRHTIHHLGESGSGPLHALLRR